MSCYVIEGGKPLCGEINLQGSKNTSLPILAAALLNKGICVIENCPDIEDVRTAIEIMQSLGCRVKREKNTVWVDSSGFRKYIIGESLMKKMRSSIVFLGSLLAVNKQAVVSYPGGCCLGERPIDIHIGAFKKMGASIYEIYGNLYCLFDKGKGADIDLSYPSVGATENIMIAATLLKGKTVIKNPAKEPEIIHLQNFLNKLGADVTGAGTDCITIKGVRKLDKYVRFSIPYDRIACVTYLAMATATGGRIKINNAPVDEIKRELEIFQSMGCKVIKESKAVILDSGENLKGFGNIKTGPYPDFSTDSQPFMCVAGAVADGESFIEEIVFENRFCYAEELKKYNVNTKIAGRVLNINKSNIVCADTYACDLRGGAALCIAALCADGISRIYNIEHIDRGYEYFDEIVRSLGGKITREDEEEKSIEGIG